MKRKIKRSSKMLIAAILVITQAGMLSSTKLMGQENISIDAETQQCIDCHGKKGNGRVITEDWMQSKHAESGIGCLDCHAANKGDVDGYTHEGQFISTIVTPNDCAECHEAEATEFMKSYHADAGAIMGSLDNVLAEVVEGHAAYNDGFNPAASNGCWQCHGSRVQLLTDEAGNPVKNEQGILQYDPKTWPNTGMGRINLDGSKGSCTACHNRHRFSIAQARQPENCGKCHLGPDHPQIEIYEESKHGINFHAHKGEMNLDAQPWIVGQDYNAAPTCATCHMSATPDQPVTHDVGDRISWTLRPAISKKIDASQLANFKKMDKEPPADFLTWEQRRSNMQNVCSQCHTKQYVTNFYIQYDNQVNMYNDKYGIPASQIMGALKKEGLMTPVKFDEELEMTFFLLWHHEGRRARMGASMMAPDYTQWHGNFEVAENFYYKFVPQVKEKIEAGKKQGKAEGAARVEELLNNILHSEMHKWVLGLENKDEMQKRVEAAKEFRKRYED